MLEAEKLKNQDSTRDYFLWNENIPLSLTKSKSSLQELQEVMESFESRDLETSLVLAHIGLHRYRMIMEKE